MHVAGAAANDDAGPLLFCLGISLWSAAIVQFSRINSAVARAEPKKRSRAFRSFQEQNDWSRIWREHVRHFPRSRARIRTVLFAVGAIVSFGLGIKFSK
jgi:hypothetical protein